MQSISKPLFAGFFSLAILSASGQSFSSYADVTVTFRSDSNTKSALISNLLEDRVGDISPIIGTAAWTEKDKRLQCRSLLSFDYGMLPKFISPEQIIEARLILQPVEILTTESVNGVRSPRFTVRRIAEQWEDSMTSWLNQPLVVTEDEVIRSVRDKKKSRTVSINVTEIVQNMFRYGNNGFMIGYADSLDNTSFLSQWFASARYEDEKLRPELQLRLSYPINRPYPYVDVAELSRQPVQKIQVPYQQPQTQPQHQPNYPVPVPVNDVPIKGGTKN